MPTNDFFAAFSSTIFSNSFISHLVSKNTCVLELLIKKNLPKSKNSLVVSAFKRLFTSFHLHWLISVAPERSLYISSQLSICAHTAREKINFLSKSRQFSLKILKIIFELFSPSHHSISIIFKCWRICFCYFFPFMPSVIHTVDAVENALIDDS